MKTDRGEFTGTRICADDFGLSRAVNRGIIHLVRAGRLDAVSCMVVGEAFSEGADALFAAANAAPCDVEVGLHFTLTQVVPLARMPMTAPSGRLPTIGSLFLAGVRGGLPLQEIADEMARQAERFAATFGRVPDFVDGHQHVHLVPGIGPALIATEPFWRGETTWVRACGAPQDALLRLPTQWGKAALLSALSARLHRGQRWPRNRAFFGVNGFRLAEDYRALMRVWLRLAAQQPNAVIMVHPANSNGDDAPDDVIARRRRQEFAYLSSPSHAADRDKASAL